MLIVFFFKLIFFGWYSSLISITLDYFYELLWLYINVIWEYCVQADKIVINAVWIDDSVKIVYVFIRSRFAPLLFTIILLWKHAVDEE